MNYPDGSLSDFNRLDREYVIGAAAEARLAADAKHGICEVLDDADVADVAKLQAYELEQALQSAVEDGRKPYQSAADFWSACRLAMVAATDDYLSTVDAREAIRVIESLSGRDVPKLISELYDMVSDRYYADQERDARESWIEGRA